VSATRASGFGTPSAAWRKRERGFALIAVLLVLALVGIVGAEFAYSMRLEASAVRAYKAGVVASHLAEAAVEQAIREIIVDAAYVGVGDDGNLTFYQRDRTARPRLARDKVPFAGGEFSYRLSDEEGRLNVNTSPPDRLERLLRALALHKPQRVTIIDSIQDWRDPDENHRLNGAESEDTYLKLPVPHRSRNGNLEAVAELLQIKGVTPAIYNGAEGRPALRDVVTVKTPGQVNINTAPVVVLQAYGLSDAEIGEIVQSRRDGPYPAVPARFAGRGLTATTRTFRIEAVGIVDGRVAARLTSVVQRRGDANNRSIVMLEWSGVR